MDELMNYIFCSLRNSETSIKSLQKVIKRQAKVNRRFATLTLLMGVYVAVSSLYIQEQDNTLNEIKMELAELKKTKGD